LLAVITFTLDFEGLEDLLEMEAGDAYLALRGLHSLLAMPRSSDDSGTGENFETIMIKAHHASLDDFLREPRRSGEFCVCSPENKLKLAHSMLKILSREQQETPGYVYREIMYNWSSYITSSVPPSGHLVPLISIFNPHFLWCRRVPLLQDGCCQVMSLQNQDLDVELGPRTSKSMSEMQTKEFVDWLKVCPPTKYCLNSTDSDLRPENPTCSSRIG
jgi:hypothetical protein